MKYIFQIEPWNPWYWILNIFYIIIICFIESYVSYIREIEKANYDRHNGER